MIFHSKKETVYHYSLEISTFFGPKWNSPDRSMPFHRAQKSLDFQGTTLLPLAFVMDFLAAKALRTGLYQS
jgi:hypothetical protein